MQASAHSFGREDGCDDKSEGPRAIGAAIGLAVWPAVHAGRRSVAASTSSNSHALLPVGVASDSRRASHCSGLTGVEGRPPQQPFHTPAVGSKPRSTQLLAVGCRRPPTDGEGSDHVRFDCRSKGPASDYVAPRQPRRGVKFIGDEGDGDDVNTASDDSGDYGSDATSADNDDLSRGRCRKSGALELPALPGSCASASGIAAKGGTGGGGGGGGAPVGGPAGVTLAFLEVLRAASRPETTLRDLYWSLVLPATRAARCAYVGLLGAEHRARPTHVVVCGWDERISDVVDCLTDHLASSAPPPGPSSYGPGTSPPPPHHLSGGGGGGGGGGGRVLAAALSSESNVRAAVRGGTESIPLEQSGAGAPSAWPSSGAAGALWGPWTSISTHSPVPSPVPSPGLGGLQSMGVWLDLFAVNFHPPATATAPAVAVGFGASVRRASPSKPYMPSLDDAAAERARALPSAIASTRSVVLLPGTQGAGLREHPVTLAAWHALRGRGCAGGAALALATPPDVDVALLQAAFEGLVVSAAARAAEDPSEAPVGAGSQSTSPDRRAVRAAREGAAGGATVAAAATAIYAADPLPSRTVREGLAAAATAAASALLARPVSLSAAARSSAVAATMMSLPPAAAVTLPPAPASPLLPPSTPQPLSPTLQSHGALQGRSFSVNALESSYTPYAALPHSTSRLSLLSSPLRSGSATAPVPIGRSLLLPAEMTSSASSTAPVAAAAAAAASSYSTAPGNSTGASLAVSLLRAPSGRSVSFTSLGLGQKRAARDHGDGDGDADNNGDSSDGRGGRDAARAGARVGELDAGGGGDGRLLRGRLGSTAFGLSGAGDMGLGDRGGDSSLTATPAMIASYDGAGGGGELHVAARRLRSLIPPLDVCHSMSLSPASLQPGLSPSGAEQLNSNSGSGSGRLLQLRSNTVAPWEASTPLPTPPNSSKGAPGLAVSGGGGGGGGVLRGSHGAVTRGDGGGSDEAAVAAAAAGAVSPAPQAVPPPPLQAPALGARAPPGPSAPDAAAAPLSMPLPRLAPLQLPGATAAPPPPTLTPTASAAAALSSTPLPLPFRDIVSAAAVEAAAGSLMGTPFGLIREGAGFKGLLAHRRGGPRGPDGGGAAAADHDPDPDLGSDTGPQDSDPDSEGRPLIVLESVSSFLTGHGTQSTLEGFATRHSHQPPPAAHQLPYSNSTAVSLPGLSPTSAAAASSTAAAAASAEFRLPPPPPPPVAQEPEAPPPYDLPPYRPLAPDLARLVGMGRLLAALGQPLAAIRLVRQALSSSRSFHGSNHPDTARCAAALGCLQLLCHQQQPQPQQQPRVKSGRDMGGAVAVASTRTRIPAAVPESDGDRYGPLGLTAFPPAAAPPAGLGSHATVPGRSEVGSNGGGGGRPGLPCAASAPIGGVLSATPLLEVGSPPLRSAASPSRARFSGGGGASTSAAATAAAPAATAAAGLGSIEEAEGLLRGASAVLERFLGPDNEETLAARRGLAAVLAADGRHGEAVTALQRAAAGRASRGRPLSEAALGSAVDLAAALAALGRAKEARKLLRTQLVRLQEDEDEAAAVAAAAAMSAARGVRSSRVAAAMGAGTAVGAAPCCRGSAASMPASPLTLLANRVPYGGGAASGAFSVPGSGCGSPVVMVGGGDSPQGPVAAGGGGHGQISPLMAPPHLQPPPPPPVVVAAARGLTPLKREELRAKCAHQLAQLKATCGKTQSARILYRRAIQSYAAVYGFNHAVTAGCMLSLAALSQSVRECGEALELYRAVLELYVEMYGPHHPATTRVSNCLGDLEEAMEEEEEAAGPQAAASQCAEGSGRSGAQIRRCNMRLRQLEDTEDGQEEAEKRGRGGK